MADERKFGVSKYWVMTAARKGVDRSDLDAMNAFFAEVREGRHDYDPELLDELVARQYLEQPERALPQLPVALPPDSELADAAESSSLVTQLRKFDEWVGDGRTLTGTGTLKLADARELVSLLDTGDELDRAGSRASAAAPICPTSPSCSSSPSARGSCGWSRASWCAWRRLLPF